MSKHYTILVLMFCLLSCGQKTTNSSVEVLITEDKVRKMLPLEIGSQAPDFNLLGVDDKQHSLNDYSSKVLAVVFSCNHCPSAQKVEDELIRLVSDYKSKGLDLVMISSCDDKAVRLDELRFSVLGDGLSDMKIRAQQKKYNFPYLYDGDKQQVTFAYGARATPHIFIFDKERKLRYQGAVSAREKIEGTDYARDAIEALLKGEEVTRTTTKTHGCSTKWSYKREAVKKDNEKWKNLPVQLEVIDEKALKELVANKSKNLRLINLWSTTCVPCMDEMPDLVEINRMYFKRKFEFITLSTDSLKDKGRTLNFLQSVHAAQAKKNSQPNYIFKKSGDFELLGDIVSKKWSGALPYTLLIAPGGEVIYRVEGRVDVMELKEKIIGYLGKWS